MASATLLPETTFQPARLLCKKQAAGPATCKPPASHRHLSLAGRGEGAPPTHPAFAWLVLRAADAAASRWRDRGAGWREGRVLSRRHRRPQSPRPQVPGNAGSRTLSGTPGLGWVPGEGSSALLPLAGCLLAISDVDTGFFPHVPTATPLNAGSLQSALLGPVLMTPTLAPCNRCGELPRAWWFKKTHT